MSKRKQRFPVHGQPQQPGQIAPGVLPGIHPGQLEDITCKNCKGHLFTALSGLKLASRFQATSGKPTIVQFQLGFACLTCGAQNQYANPELSKPETEEKLKPGGTMSETQPKEKIN